MPSAQTITLADGQATPVNHQFRPVSVERGQTLLVNEESASSAGQMNLILSYDRRKPSRPTDRIRVQLNIPIEQTVDGVVKVAHTARFDGSFVLPEELTAAQRDDLAAFARNALSDAIIAGYVENLDPMY